VKKLPATKKPKILFRDSEWNDADRLQMALLGTPYETANVQYYVESARNWSDGDNNRKVDWLATVKNWMARDMTEGKFITTDFKPQQKNKNGTGKQPTGGDVSLKRIFNTIDEFYSKTGQ
jgi:hypothetical protein